jgi:hypothetical protein
MQNFQHLSDLLLFCFLLKASKVTKHQYAMQYELETGEVLFYVEIYFVMQFKA